MGKLSSSLATVVGRILKVVMAAIVLPFAVTLVLSLLEQLDLETASGATFRQWVVWGAMTYIGIDVLLYRPASLFRVSRALFSKLAEWLFGGHVASVESSGAGGKRQSGKSSKAENAESKGRGKGDGSTLVAFSPYAIPLYAILACALAWLLSHWIEPRILDGAAAFLIGLAIAFHWLMTADELQEQRSQWHLETYLLAIGLVFVLTLLIGSACLPWAIPDFSFVRALSGAFVRAQHIYTMVIQRLFF